MRLRAESNYLCYNPSDEQIIALMRKIASHGRSTKPKLTPAQCGVVAEFLIAESQRLGCRLDIRLLVDKAFLDFAQCRNHNTETHWKDLVRAMLQEQVSTFEYTRKPVGGRKMLKEMEQQIVREISATYLTTAEQITVWQAQTQKSERAFYRRLKEINV